MEVPLGNYDGPFVGADRQPCPMSAHGQRLSTVRCFAEGRIRCIAYAGKASAPELSTSQKSPSAAAGISTASPQIPPGVAKQSFPKILQYATKHLEPSIVCHFPACSANQSAFRSVPAKHTLSLEAPSRLVFPSSATRLEDNRTTSNPPEETHQRNTYIVDELSVTGTPPRVARGPMRIAAPDGT